MASDDQDQEQRWEPTAFGTFVKSWRTSRNLSQVKMAKDLMMSDTYLSQIERGRIPDLSAPDFFDTWTRVLGVTRDELIARGELWRHNPIPAPDVSPRLMQLHYRTNHLTDEELERFLRAADDLFPDHSQGHAASLSRDQTEAEGTGDVGRSGTSDETPTS